MTFVSTLPEPPSALIVANDGRLTLAFPKNDALQWDGGQLSPADHTSVLTDAQSNGVPDQHGNRWRIDRPLSGNHATRLLVRSAQAPTNWIAVETPTLEGEWTHVCGDEYGFVWMTDGLQLYRHDPRKNTLNWTPFPDAFGFPKARLTALARSPGGWVMAGFSSGEVVEVDLGSVGASFVQTLINASDGIGPIDHLLAGRDGSVFVVSGDRLYRKPPAESWRHAWRELARLPGGNHDVFAAEYAGQVYVAGGLTGYWGYPAQSHVFDELFVYDQETDVWTIRTRMPFPRCYNGIAVIDDHVWIVGGAANLSRPDDPDGPRVSLDSVIRYDRSADCWRDAPPLRFARIEPVVAVVQGRLFAIGGADTDGKTLDVMESIAPGEASWRLEPPAPAPVRQAAGCVLNNRLYVCSRDGFWCFDPANARWDAYLSQPPVVPQAPLVATHQGCVWVMGGYPQRATWRYQPEENRWIPGPDLPTEQSWGAAWSLNGRLMAIAGAHWSERHTVYVYDERVFELSTTSDTATGVS